MSPQPRIFTGTYRIKFSDLDPYNHLRTAAYAAYYVDHRMEALRHQAGWDVEGLARLPFMAWVKHQAIDFLKPVLGDQLVTISSFVESFAGSEAHIRCTMMDAEGKPLSRCLMVVTCVDKHSLRPRDWPVESMMLFVDPDASR